MKISKYFNLLQRLTHNFILYFGFGGRGIGKTYSFKEWAIKSFLKNKSQFILLRRYAKEISRDKMELFFDDIAKNFDVEIKYKNGQFYLNDDLFGFAVCLSRSSYYKSVPFPNVDKMLFDEVIIPKTSSARYLKNEPFLLNEFISTVFRDRKIKVVCFSNLITKYNPYTLYYNVDISKDIYKDTKRGIFFEFIESKEFAKHMKDNTDLGRLIADTEYSNYAFDNISLDDENTFIEKKGKNATQQFVIIARGVTYGVWADFNEGKIFISKDHNKQKFTTTFVLQKEDMKPNLLLMSNMKNTRQYKLLKNAFTNGCLYYEKADIKNSLEDIFNYML